jgi:hypothetical protein
MVSGGTEANGTGVSMGFAFRDYGDRSVLYAGARGSEGDDVIDISAFASGGRPGSTASVRVEGKGGNDTITVKSNGAIRVEGGGGDDTIAVTASGKSVMATADVEGGAGNDTISLIGGGLASGGGGDDVIHIQHTSSESAAIGFGGAGDDVIIGVGHGNVAFGGDGNDTISGVGMVFGSAGDDIIALDNSAYSRVYFRSGATTGFGDFGHATVILSDPAAGVGDNGRPYFEKYAFDNQGNHILAKPADADGNYSGKYANYLDVLPTEGQAGYGLTHTIIDFHGYRPDQIDSTLNGTDLTLSVRATGQSVLLRNYQPGRVTFSLFDSATGEINASRQPPGLLSGASP